MAPLPLLPLPIPSPYSLPLLPLPTPGHASQCEAREDALIASGGAPRTIGVARRDGTLLVVARMFADGTRVSVNVNVNVNVNANAR
jgi:hypothetical protein